jgi:hypothetical protein
MGVLSLSLALKKDNEYISSKLDSTKKELIAYADEQDFLNLSPKLGQSNEKEMLLTVSGLTATFPEMDVFLGGYCSLLKTQSIQLNANQTNYVYLIRNREDRHTIDVFIRDKSIGIEGENAFNRILIVKFTTDSNKVTSSRYFQV